MVRLRKSHVLRLIVLLTATSIAACGSQELGVNPQTVPVNKQESAVKKVPVLKGNYKMYAPKDTLPYWEVKGLLDTLYDTPKKTVRVDIRHCNLWTLLSTVKILITLFSIFFIYFYLKQRNDRN